MYLAAVIHDFGHKGVNNDFLIKSHDRLALVYNDRSPMENHHVSATWILMMEEGHNFLRKMPQKAVDVLRKQIIDMVLATDMKQVRESEGREEVRQGQVNPMIKLIY